MTGFPPPDFTCPSEADEDRLGELMPQPEDVDAALEVDELGLRFVDAAVYCREADEKLR